MSPRGIEAAIFWPQPDAPPHTLTQTHNVHQVLRFRRKLYYPQTVGNEIICFDILLTVHLNTFILILNNLMH